MIPTRTGQNIIHNIIMERSFLLGLFLRLCKPATRFVNRVNWRFGRPFRCRYDQIDPVRECLQPGVIVLTHKKYEFSTLFIPGYWTHTALVISGESIIEATGKGVQLNSTASFFSGVDDFILLKPRFCCQDAMKQAGDQAFLQAGLPFSFDFRNSGGMFYCSGLVCWAYAQTLAGREKPVSMPPVLQNFLKGNIIKPIDLYDQQDTWQVVGSYRDIYDPVNLEN
jgi:hypothetical protein